jgi:hypothetical protein
MASDQLMKRAYKFVKYWQPRVEAGHIGEKGNAIPFMSDFYDVFGISKSLYGQSFEKIVKIDGRTKYADSLLPHVVVIEMESQGVQLLNNPGVGYDQAFQYAYNAGADSPKFIIACDFENFYISEPDKQLTWETDLQHFVDNLDMFGFLLGYEQREQQAQAIVNAKAAESISEIYRHVVEVGVPARAASLLMTRIVFCFFADDTGIFDKDSFKNYLVTQTAEDGSDTLLKIVDLFNLLNSDHWLGDRGGFPFINGGLFAYDLARETTKQGLRFNASTRRALIRACEMDWSQISPVIFGSMFEGALDPDKRHDLGAHFTSEKNILKVIDSLYMDKLRDEFEAARRQPIKYGVRSRALDALHTRLAGLKFLDPACGSGNFLIIAYREIRRLETKLIDEEIKIEQVKQGKQSWTPDFTTFESNFRVEVSQFYGLEYEAYAVSIARLGLWLMDHLMNMEASKIFGMFYRRIPLHMGANIQQADSLMVDWFDCLTDAASDESREIKPLAVDDLDYILGNPPFLGKSLMNKEQKAGMEFASRGTIKKWRSLDYVAGWYVKTAQAMMQNDRIEAALVSTNSITQGEQATILWPAMFNAGININFAHRTFKWDNNGAAVFVVIIGFSRLPREKRNIFEYPDIKGDPDVIECGTINEYLLPYPPVGLIGRKTQISGLALMNWGSKLTDGQNFLFSLDEKDELIKRYPIAEAWLRPYYSAAAMLSDSPRYALYLYDVPVHEIKKVPPVVERLRKVREMRAASSKPGTRIKADRPTEYDENNVLEGLFLAIPRVNIARRNYLPIEVLESPKMVSDANFELPFNKKVFAILESQMFMAWLRTIGGELKGDLRFSNELVYNTFVFPETTAEQDRILEISTSQILKAREAEKLKGNTLADIYDPNLMGYGVRQAHADNDKIVEGLYGLEDPSDVDRLTCLLDLYRKRNGR